MESGIWISGRGGTSSPDPHILRHPDHGERKPINLGGFFELKRPADRIAISPERARHGLVDDDSTMRAGEFLGKKIAASHQGNTHSAEIIAGDPAVFGSETTGMRRQTGDIDIAVVARILHRKQIDRSGALNSSKVIEAFNEFTEEFVTSRSVLATAFRQGNMKCKQMRSVQPRVDAHEILKALQ